MAGPIDSGISEHSHHFLNHYEIDPHFDIGCALSCMRFLTEERGYDTAVDSIRRVKFQRAETSCYVDGPQGNAGVHGVVKTGSDPNLGEYVARPVDRSHSYQLYGDRKLSGLAVGGTTTARIESISMPQIKSALKVANCYFSYADAALLELYRAKENQGSLKGTCCWPLPPEKSDGEAKDIGGITDGMRKVAIKGDAEN